MKLLAQEKLIKALDELDYIEHSGDFYVSLEDVFDVVENSPTMQCEKCVFFKLVMNDVKPKKKN